MILVARESRWVSAPRWQVRHALVLLFGLVDLVGLALLQVPGELGGVGLMSPLGTMMLLAPLLRPPEGQGSPSGTGGGGPGSG